MQHMPQSWIKVSRKHLAEAHFRIIATALTENNNKEGGKSVLNTPTFSWKVSKAKMARNKVSFEYKGSV